MASLNKVLLLGNLTREPALRYTPSGAAVCELGMAMNRRFTSNGQDKDETCFVDIVVWGKQAESSSRYLQKGAPVLIEGRLQFDQWEDKESGAKRSKLRVVAERVQFMSRGSDGERSEGSNQQQQDQGAPAPPSGGSNFGGKQQPPKQQQYQAPEPPRPPQDKVFDVDDLEDDIPF